MVVLGAGYVFFNTLFAGVPLIPVVFFYVRIRQQGYVNKKRQELLLQFKAGMEAVSVALMAGYSVENAFFQAGRELGYMYGSSSEIVTLFKRIEKELSVNKNIEDILMDFAKNTQLEDIMSFAEVFKFAKRTGGDVVQIIRNTTETIGQKAEVVREISILISGKQMEQAIMDVVPIGIILYLRIGSPELLMPLYEGITGRCIMSVCLLVYILAVGISLHITNIKV